MSTFIVRAGNVQIPKMQATLICMWAYLHVLSKELVQLRFEVVMSHVTLLIFFSLSDSIIQMYEWPWTFSMNKSHNL